MAVARQGHRVTSDRHVYHFTLIDEAPSELESRFLDKLWAADFEVFEQFHSFEAEDGE